VESVETVGKSGEAMCDGRVGRRILAKLNLQQGEQKEPKDKPGFKIAKKRIPLPNARNGKSCAREVGEKAPKAQCGRS